MARQYVVIGCHGSGVEVVAEIIDRLGVYADNGPFTALNGRLLQRSGGDWRNPPPTDDILAVTMCDEEMARVASKHDAIHAAWGWSDPQTCLTLPKWAPLLSAPTYVWVGRSIRGTETEMRNKHHIDTATARMLMRRYLADAGLFLAGPHNGRLVSLNYDQLCADPAGQVASLARWLRVETDAAHIADATAHIGGNHG